MPQTQQMHKNLQFVGNLKDVTVLKRGDSITVICPFGIYGFHNVHGSTKVEEEAAKSFWLRYRNQTGEKKFKARLKDGVIRTHHTDRTNRSVTNVNYTTGQTTTN